MSASLQLVCSTCLALNQVPVPQLCEHPICGVCRTRLAGALPADLTPHSFARFVGQNHLPVLVEFWSPASPSCLATADEPSEIARELEGRVLLARVNVASHPELAAAQQVAGGPVLVLYLEGRELARHSPSANAAEIRAWAGGA